MAPESHFANRFAAFFTQARWGISLALDTHFVAPSGRRGILVLIFCWVRKRRELFGLIDSGIVDRPIPLLVLIVDLNETPLPLNLQIRIGRTGP